MTREEAIAILDDKETVIDNPNYLSAEIGEAWEMAVEALAENESLAKSVIEASELLRKKRPYGEWIPCKSTRTGQVTNIDYKCSKCSHHKDRPMPYCEICGSIMKRREAVKRNESAESR